MYEPGGITMLDIQAFVDDVKDDTIIDPETDATHMLFTDAIEALFATRPYDEALEFVEMAVVDLKYRRTS
jgi:hypothetical protein